MESNKQVIPREVFVASDSRPLLVSPVVLVVVTAGSAALVVAFGFVGRKRANVVSGMSVVADATVATNVELSKGGSVDLAVGDLVGRGGKGYRAYVSPEIHGAWDDNFPSPMDSAISLRVLEAPNERADPFPGRAKGIERTLANR